MTDPNVPSETPATPPAPPAATPPPAPYAAPYAAAPAAAGPKQGLSLTSFILGLGGLVLSWIPFFGPLVSIAAVILGFIGKAKEPGAPKWMWIVGLITGFVGILLGILFIVILVIVPLIFLSSVGSNIGNLPGY